MAYNKCKKYSCICQRYRPKEDAPNECLYCHHSVGYHESITIDTSEYPYGPCNQTQCGCQRFKNQNSSPLLCIYCNHYDGFHSDWPLNTTNNVLSSDNITQNNANQRHSNRRAGRTPADILKINTIICFDQRPYSIPKTDSPFWNDLKSRNMIKRDIKISNNSSSIEIYNLIYNLFSDHLNGQRWCLFNGSSGKLRKVIYNEITFDLIKRNLTKSKKMYIAPDTFGIGSNSAVRSENLSSEVQPENSSSTDSDSTVHLEARPENSSSLPTTRSEIHKEISFERDFASITATLNDTYDLDWDIIETICSNYNINGMILYNEVLY